MNRYENVNEATKERIIYWNRRRRIKKVIKFAIPILILLAGILYPSVYYPAKHYRLAEKYISEKNYGGARGEFMTAKNFKDSKERIYETYFLEAEEQYMNGDFLNAALNYENAESYGGAVDRAREVWESLGDLLTLEHDYSGALEAYRKAGNDGRANQKSDEIKKELWMGAEVGSLVFMGKYEQDADIQNGPEDIEWIILEKNDDSILLLSRYCLDSKPYNDNFFHGVTWDSCSLRTWLNGEFLNMSFSEEEKDGMLYTQIPDPVFPDEELDSTVIGDRLFLLSVEEVNRLFDSYEAAQAAATEYAVNNGVWISDNLVSSGGRHNSRWLLRTPGEGYITEYNTYMVLYVNGYGRVPAEGIQFDEHGYGIRPAVWVRCQ